MKRKQTDWGMFKRLKAASKFTSGLFDDVGNKSTTARAVGSCDWLGNSGLSYETREEEGIVQWWGCEHTIVRVEREAWTRQEKRRNVSREVGKANGGGL